jgi:GNAT superfamily N-acetyltransferase
MVGIITVTEETVETHGFFCKMSARKSQAWQDKRAWLRARFAEGLQLRLLGDGERGFVEFIPGRHAWRAIEGAEDFVVIHCLWVVGKSKGKGHSTALLDEVEAWARQNGFRGVAALTSSGNWLIAPGVLERRGYRVAETATPGFALLVRAFEPGPEPRLSGGWEDKARALGPGLVVLRSAQCPYLEDAAANARAAAEKLGLRFSDRIIETAQDVRRLSPTPYGVFALVLDGVLISSTYLLEKDILKRIAQRP